MSKLYFFVENRIGKLPTLFFAIALILLVSVGVLSYDEIGKLLSVILTWFE